LCGCSWGGKDVGLYTPLFGPRAVSCVQTDRQTDTHKQTGQNNFNCAANAPKKCEKLQFVTTFPVHAETTPGIVFFFPLTFFFGRYKLANDQESGGRRGKLFITSPSDQSGVSPRTIVKARFTVSAHKTPTKLWDGPLLHKYSRNVSVMVQL